MNQQELEKRADEYFSCYLESDKKLLQRWGLIMAMGFYDFAGNFEKKLHAKWHLKNMKKMLINGMNFQE